MQDLRSLTQSELTEALASMGEKKFRAAQIYQWLHVHMADSFDEMTNLSAALRQKLKDQCSLVTLKPVKVLTSQIDGTKKFLFELPDGNIIESVWMQYHHGNSVCISSPWMVWSAAWSLRRCCSRSIRSKNILVSEWTVW